MVPSHHPLARSILREALVPVLSRVAFFSETHSIKGLLALDRLAQRYDLSDEELRTLLDLNQLLATPRAFGPLSAQCDQDGAVLEDKRIRAHLDLPVFPIAYVAAVEWCKRRGPRDLVDAYRAAAARNIDFLGHAWTIWASFYELLPVLENDAREDALAHTLFAERFAELVAVQLAAPGPKKLPPVDPPRTDDDVAIRLLALKHPGYLAHTSISAAYLYRHRDLVDRDAWTSAMHVVHRMAASHETSTWAGTMDPYEGPVDDATFARVTREALERGPREVHTVTALDALHDLWSLDDEPTKRGVLAVATWLRDMEFVRAGSGERAT